MAKDKLPISALILTKNEQENIEDCLKQLSFLDEIILLDNGSQDRTLEIAKKFQCRVITSKEESFSTRRNMLARAAKNDWLLYIDADERLEEESIDEIKKAITASENSSYTFKRKNIILGKWLKHGGWWPDYVPRLFKKSQLIKWVGKVHESPKTDGTTGELKTPLTHLTAPTVSHMFEKTIKYAKVEAELYFKSESPKVNVPKVIYASSREFFRRYIAKLGFLDGKVGLIESAYQAYHTAVVLMYLWELQNETFKKYQKSDA